MYLNENIGTFNQSLLIRDSRECATGQQWYVCTANNFQGCCSVNACAVSECPDSSTAAVGASKSSTISPSTSSFSTETTSSTASTTSSQTTKSSQVTLQTPKPSTILLTTTISNSIITTQTSSSSTTILADSTTHPSSNSTPIIAGAIVGSIALICFAVAAFCCFRFRQKKKQDRERMFAEPESPNPETIQFYTTTGKTLQTPSSTRTSRNPSGGFSGLGGLGLGDVFASFGGKSRSTSTSPPSTSLLGGPSMTESQISAPISLMHPMPTIHPTPTPESPEDHEHDKQLPSDPEKSSLMPPPEFLHPAFHVLPGTSSRPAYRSELDFTINELDGREIGRRSDSIGARSEGMSMIESEGIVSPMSTPNMSAKVSSNGFSTTSTPPFNLSVPVTSMNIPQGYEHKYRHREVQGTWHSNASPNNLPPNGHTSTRPQYSTQSYHERNNSSTNNSNSNSNSPNLYPIHQQQPQAQTQTQYAQQLAQARRMNATIIENPYQIYRNSREHQQNKGYRNALEQAQAQDRARNHGQVLVQGQVQAEAPSQEQRQIPSQKGKERERERIGGETEQKDSGLKRESSTHSIPIGLSLDAESSVSPPKSQNRNREMHMDTREGNARLRVHDSLDGDCGDLYDSAERRMQIQSSYTDTPAHSVSRSHSRTGSVGRVGNYTSPSNLMDSTRPKEQIDHRIPAMGSVNRDGNGNGNGIGEQKQGFTPPGFDLECRVVSPTPLP
ncbi:ff38a728-af88-4838-9d06-43d5c3e830fc [Sclerotinia trifoliorum]|uniref:Ff38a728-af88-4838-9d06-43d5c3e830fc n=1 Tax=Sclerotinia trifoliorum TaxID=28548 RepID=A0A8H2ZS78_9HELO|nr:ff38a728-af88-4838-9d06-43d5c3e830fc [Sclerotinia trifoliorum]